MKIAKIIIVIIFLGTLGFAVSKFVFNKALLEKKDSEKLGEESYYTCPMHPHIHSDKPGKCPICSMDLVLVETEKSIEKSMESKDPPMSVNQEALSNAGIDTYEVKIDNLSISVPFSGRFNSKNAISFQIYESDLRLIRPGLPVMIRPVTEPDLEIRGKVGFVDSIIEPTSRTVRVTATFGEAANIVSQTTAFGSINIELKNILVVPESAILHAGSKNLVYLIEDGNKLQSREVSIGAKGNGLYEIIDGLKVGDKISSGPNFLLDSEAKIRGL